MAAGSSGKAGGLLAEWATPKCLAPLSFKTHNELAKKHNGGRIWGHRRVYCADVKLLAQNLDQNESAADACRGPVAQSPLCPEKLDWLLPNSVTSYKEIGDPSNTAQVNPYMFTITLAALAVEAGAKIIIGCATAINYKDNKERVESVTYTENGHLETLDATDVLVAAGPWTPKLLPSVQLLTPRGHSVVVHPSRDLSPYVLFPDIKPAPNSGLDNLISPEIYPRPGDGLYSFDTVYASGPDDYEVPLPSRSDSVETDERKCEEVWTAIKSVSKEIHDGQVVVRQACYKPQIRKHEEDEEVGPIVGQTSTKGLFIATGHDEWGIQNAPGTGLVMSEMIFEGAAKSADCESLDPKHFLKEA